MHKILLTAGLLGVLFSAPTPLSAQIDQAMLDKVKAEVLPVVSKATGVDLSKVVIRIGDRDDLRDMIEGELAARPSATEQSAGQRRVTARAASRMLLAKFGLVTKEILICTKNFEWQAKAVKRPELNALDAFRAVLVHECIHATDDKQWDWSKRFLQSTKTPAEINAYQAVIEGHAQFVAAKICRDNGWQKGFDTYTSIIGMTSPDAELGEKLLEQMLVAKTVASYADGHRFMTAIAKKSEKNIEKAFTQPPRDFEEVLHPDWYLDPTLRPKNIYQFREPLKHFAKQHSDDDWSKRPVTLTGPQIRAAMSLLDKAEVDRLLAHLKQNRMMVLNDKANPNNKMVIAGLYEFDSPEEALFYRIASEKLSRTKDEKMKTGQIKILDAKYTEISEDSMRGQLVRKTVGFAGQRVPVTSVIASRGSVGVELLYSNEKVGDDVVMAFARSLLELSLNDSKKTEKNTAAPKKVDKDK